MPRREIPRHPGPIFASLLFEEPPEMKVAIKMRRVATEHNEWNADADRPYSDCFAEFELQDDDQASENVADDEDDADTVQVTVVLRGKRAELENPALSVTELVLNALEARSQNKRRGKQVIDAMGVGVAG
jgi:hypothetical protein